MQNLKLQLKIKNYFTFFLLTGVLFFAFPACAEIQLEVEFPKFGGEQLGPQSTLPETIQYIFNAVLGIIFLVVLVSLIYGGFLYLTSVGEPAKMAKGKKQIFGSVLGLLIVLASFFLLRAINPQLTILQIEKKPVVYGVLLLNKQAYDEITLLGPNISERELEKKLQELIDAPSTEAKAVYLHSSISDLQAMFGQLPTGTSAGPSPNFPNFELYGLYFLPDTNVKVLEFYWPNFKSSKEYTEPLPPDSAITIADNEYSYPDCSSMGTSAEPCKFKLIDRKRFDGDIPGGYVGHPPLSLQVKGIGPGVYLYSDYLGWELSLSGIREIPFLREAPYWFDNMTKKIEVRNWVLERNLGTGDFEPQKKSNYLAILFGEENFEAPLRIFFEEFFIGAGLYGNLERDEKIEITANADSDLYGKTEEPSSVRVFPMPCANCPDNKEWQEWLKGADGNGCKVTVCAEKHLGQAGSPPNPKACFEYSFEATLLEPEDLSIKDVEIREISADGSGFKTDSNGLYITKEVSLENNVRSLNIEGNCAVVLFENPTNNFKGGGSHSEVFVPWGKEFEQSSGYLDLTETNTLFYHPVGQCNCTPVERFVGFFTRQGCAPCASSIAVYPIMLSADFAPASPSVPSGPSAGYSTDWQKCLATSQLAGGSVEITNPATQISDASSALTGFLNCLAGKYPPVKNSELNSRDDCYWVITSISDSNGIPPEGQAGAHQAYSCHYGGQDNYGSSYAIDISSGNPAPDVNKLKNAAADCTGGSYYWLDEGTHYHLSTGCYSN